MWASHLVVLRLKTSLPADSLFLLLSGFNTIFVRNRHSEMFCCLLRVGRAMMIITAFNDSVWKYLIWGPSTILFAVEIIHQEQSSGSPPISAELVRWSKGGGPNPRGYMCSGVAGALLKTVNFSFLILKRGKLTLACSNETRQGHKVAS